MVGGDLPSPPLQQEDVGQGANSYRQKVSIKNVHS